MKEAGRFTAAFTVKMSKKQLAARWSSLHKTSISIPRWLFPHAIQRHVETRYLLSPGRRSDWQRVFISLAWDNGRKLPLKPPFFPPRRFKSSRSRKNRATKEKKGVQSSQTKRSEHEKQSSKAIFIPLQFEVPKLKLHMDAIETRATRGD